MTDVAAVLLKLTPDEADYIEKLLDESDGELAPAIMRALAYADTIPVTCPTCQGRRYVQQFESGGDSAKGTGWANLTQHRCPTCSPTEGTSND